MYAAALAPCPMLCQQASTITCYTMPIYCHVPHLTHHLVPPYMGRSTRLMFCQFFLTFAQNMPKSERFPAFFGNNWPVDLHSNAQQERKLSHVDGHIWRYYATYGHMSTIKPSSKGMVYLKVCRSTRCNPLPLSPIPPPTSTFPHTIPCPLPYLIRLPSTLAPIYTMLHMVSCTH